MALSVSRWFRKQPLAAELASAWCGERYSTSGGRAHNVFALKLEIGARYILSVILQLIVFVAVNVSFLD